MRIIKLYNPAEYFSKSCLKALSELFRNSAIILSSFAFILIVKLPAKIFLMSIFIVFFSKEPKIRQNFAPKKNRRKVITIFLYKKDCLFLQKKISRQL
jgi:Ni,Fe-hydrogenase I cytochrome b subunit